MENKYTISHLRKLVPEWEICKEIPEGSFAETPMVWVHAPGCYCPDSYGGEWSIDFRCRMKEGDVFFPAPTLEEVIEDMARKNDFPYLRAACEWYVRDQAQGKNPGTLEIRVVYGISSFYVKEVCENKAVTTALKIWLINRKDNRRNAD